MHEVGIIESALATVLDCARAAHAERVHRIRLRIGTLAGVDADALRFAFDAVVAGTPAAGATLDIDVVPASAYCATCRCDFTPASGFIFACPVCSGLSADLRAGRELELSRIEMS